MSFDGLITNEAKELYGEAIDELIRGLGVECLLLYKGAKWNPCSNCHVNPQTGQSTGTYKEGGPISFDTGVCPHCKGRGMIPLENTENIVLGVIWDDKKFMGTKINKGSQSVQTLCAVEHYPKLKATSQLIVDVNVMDYSKNTFERDGEPYFAGFGNSNYIFLTWKRVA